MTFDEDPNHKIADYGELRVMQYHSHTLEPPEEKFSLLGASNCKIPKLAQLGNLCDAFG